MQAWKPCAFVVTGFILFSSILINCQSLPCFEHGSTYLPNNSYIYYANISNGDRALKCVTDSDNCCTDSDVGNWTDGRGRAVHQGADETTCLYVTRGHGQLSLNRNSGCIPDTSGLWRCDVPDSSEVMQSMYIYVSNDTTSGALTLSSTDFTLHTEPSVSPPEFTVTCRTQGGPATTVEWQNSTGHKVERDNDHETSQVIVNTSNSTYESRLRVRGKENGTYVCIIRNNHFPFKIYTVSKGVTVKVAGEPTNLTAVISHSNSTHVNITVSWKSPGDPVTGYVIYYQSKREEVSSDMVSGAESHLLDGLQGGVTYNISIVALSKYLPSPLVGPVTVNPDPVLTVEIALTTSPNNTFTVACTARAEVDGQGVFPEVIIEWTHTSLGLSCVYELLHSSSSTSISSEMYSVLNPTNYNTCISKTGNNSEPENNATTATTPTCLNVSYYQSILTATENNTDVIIYGCAAKLLNDSKMATAIVTVTVMPNNTTSKCSTDDIKPTSLTSSLKSDSSRSSAPGSSSISSGSHSVSEITSESNLATDIALSGVTNSTLSSSDLAPLSIVTTTASQNISSGDYGGTYDNDSFLAIALGLASATLVLIILLAMFGCLVFLKGCRKEKVWSSQRQTIEQELTIIFTKKGENDDIMLTEGRVQRKGAIAASNFPDYVQRVMREDEGNSSMLANEYMELQRVPRLPCRVACLSHNAKSNRFRNIHPYDDSRVCLPEIPGVEGSDYVNASIITGYNGLKYIAAQGPLRGTVIHFWRMIWEYNVQAIVMLTRCVEMSKQKCAQYWPKTLNGSTTLGDMLKVTLSSSLPYAEYEIRKFEVNSLLQPATNPLTVTQFHYTAWPDHGAPDNVMSIISFIRHVCKLFPVSLDQQLLVHCSAGVGRTGTFITLDTMMWQMKAEDTLSVYQCVRNLRTQRMNMVQTLDQYEFIHHALSELVVCGETEVTASSLRSFTDRLRDQESGTRITGANKHLQTLEYLSTQHKYDFTGANNLENVHKNRFSNKLPNELYRVLLSYNGKHEYGYINASFINGYKQRGAYIATQGPLQNTVDDFWRMVWEYQCGCIVMLCQLVEDRQESSYCYWPGEEGEEMVCGKLRVRLRLVSSHGDTVTRKMEVTSVDHDSNTTNMLIVTMIQLISWPQQGLPHPTAITSLIDKVTSTLIKCPYKKIVVMCSDGVVRSGTFICIHSQLERLKTEGVVDVFQAIKSARIQRPGLISNTDHYMFCYEVLAKYVEGMDTYANFKAIM